MFTFVLILILSLLLGIVGVAHLVVPRRFLRLVPPWWPAPLATVYVSGLVEIFLAVTIATQATRVVGASLAVVLFVAYSAVHADTVRNAYRASTFMESPPGVAARVFANLLYALLALWVALHA